MPVTKHKKESQRQMAEACMKVSQTAFESLDKTLTIYLSWLMHSEELRDLSVYHSIKARIYGFRRASAGGEATESTHELRCMVLLLLAHQFDAQRIRGYLADAHLDWELRALLKILREGWRRG